MDPLTAVGMGVSLIGGIAGSAGVEAENRRRMEMIQKHLATRRLESLNSGINLLSKQKASTIAQAGGDAEMRAIAMGRGNDVEGFVQPQVNKVAAAADTGINQFISNTDQMYERLQSENDMNFASRPIQPNAGHYMSVLGSGISQFAQQQGFLKNLESLYSKYGIQSGNDMMKNSGMNNGVSVGDTGISDFTNKWGGMGPENN